MTFVLKIEKGIPIPPRRRGGRPNRYRFGLMKVGDSFLLLGAGSAVEAAASRYGRKHGMRFTARYVEGGTRIWRIE